MTVPGSLDAQRDLARVYRQHQIYDSFGSVMAAAAAGIYWVGATLAGLLQGLSVMAVPYTSIGDVVTNPFRVLVTSPATPEAVWGPGWVNGAVYWATAVTAMALLVASYLRGRRGVVERRRNRLAGLASRHDVSSLVVTGPVPRRMVVGWGPGAQLLAIEPRHSLAVIGATGMGKTFTGVIPIVKEHSGAVIVTTLKSSLLAPTVAARQRWGNVYVFDPLRLVTEPLPRLAWSPIAASSTYATALRVANRLAQAYALLGKGDAFWAREGEDLIAAALYGAHRCGHTMANLIVTIRECAFTQWITALEHVPDGSMPRALLTETMGLPERQRSSRTVSAIDFVRVYQDPNLSRPDPTAVVLDPAEFARSTDTLYVVAPLGDQARLAPVLTALIDAFTEPVMSATPNTTLGDPNVLVAVEEAANSAVLPNLPELLNTGREQGLTLITVWQSLAQIRARYGDKADEVIDGHRGVIVYGGSKDPVTLQWLQHVAGDGMVMSGSVTAGDHQSWQTSHQHRPVLPAELSRAVEFGGALLVYGTLRVIRLRARTPNQVALPASPNRRLTPIQPATVAATAHHPHTPAPTVAAAAVAPPGPAGASEPVPVLFDVAELEGDLFGHEPELAVIDDDAWLAHFHGNDPPQPPQLTLLDSLAEPGGDHTTR